MEEFFARVQRPFEDQGLLPSNPMTQALAYAGTRRAVLEVFLTDPDVAVDTNHLARAPCGRYPWVAKSGLSAWTGLGAKHVGIVQSLLVTCRLHDIDPHIYLLDVLQRVGDHPASRVAELTPTTVEAALRGQPASLGTAYPGALSKNVAG